MRRNNPGSLGPDQAREIAEECYGEVMAYCRRHAPAGHDPADLAQETFLRFGIVVVDMPKHVDCTDLWVTVFDDGLTIRVADKLPVRYVRMRDVVFGASADDDLTSILLTSMPPEEISHARAELSGEGYDDVWTPAEG